MSAQILRRVLARAKQVNSLPLSVPDDDYDVSESFLSVFDIDSFQPRITEEQEEMEKAKMTDEERVAALSDMFGQFCSVTSHQSKRARKDVDSESIQFLLNQMKIEINRIPVTKKQALLEARVTCEPFEFSDERLKRFLRCEGMNAEVRAFECFVVYVFEGYECITSPSLDLLYCVQLGAQRFVNYWESRREVFGPDKYKMRMTLSGALHDDLDALNDDVLCLLPYLDLSGRQLLYFEPNRRSEGRYSPESLVR